MSGIVRFSLILLLIAAAARADEPPEAVTYLGQNLLPRTDLAARGLAAGTSRVGAGAALLTFRVEEILHGQEDREEILLMSPDPTFFPPKDVPAILFLRRLGVGRYEPLARMDLTGGGAASRIEVMKRYLEIEALPDLAGRRSALHDCLMENLGSGDRFRAASAIRELAHFTSQHPASFSKEDAAAIRAKLETTRDAELGDLLATTLENLGATAGGDDREEPEADTPPVAKRVLPIPREFRDLRAAWDEKPASADRRLSVLRAICARHLKHAAPVLLQALGDPAAGIRETAALNLGEAEAMDSVDALLKLLAREKERAVQAAAIQALGVLGSSRALEPVLTFGRDPDLLRPVAFAAARIGGTVATDWLRGLAATHAGTDEADRAVRELVQFLLSEDFRKQEAALAKIRKRRLR